MAELSRIVATITIPNTLLRITNTQETTRLTRIAIEAVAALHKPLLREFGNAVCRYAITLHFSKTQATFARTALSWLASEHNKRP